MSGYEETAAAVTVGPVGGITALIGDLLTSDFVQEAIHHAVVAVAAAGVPTSPSSTDAPGGTQQALDVRITKQVLPPTEGSGTTDEATIHMQCTTYTLHVLGHHIGTWTTCEDVITSPDPLPSGDAPAAAVPAEGGGERPEVRRVRLDLTAAPPAAAGAPAWVAPLTAKVVSADLVTQALVVGVLDAVVRHGSDDTTDAPASIVLTSHDSSGSTDSGGALQCHDHFFTVGGVQLYHWTVCTETTDIGPSHPPPVHLEVEHPKHHH